MYYLALSIAQTDAWEMQLWSPTGKMRKTTFQEQRSKKETIWVPGVLSNRSAFFWWIQWAMNRNLCNTWEDLHTFWQVDWGILSAKRWLHLEDHQHSAFSLSQLITSICTSRMLDWSCHTLLYLLISSTSNLLTRLVILKWSTKLNNSWTKIIKWKVKQTNKQGFLIFTISKFNKEETNTVLQKLPENIWNSTEKAVSNLCKQRYQTSVEGILSWDFSHKVGDVPGYTLHSKMMWCCKTQLK